MERQSEMERNRKIERQTYRHRDGEFEKDTYRQRYKERKENRIIEIKIKTESQKDGGKDREQQRQRD
jgi:hypothetical protein